MEDENEASGSEMTYAEARAMVNRQIALWVSNGEEPEGFGDWHSHGVLLAPRGVEVSAQELPFVINQWHSRLEALTIDVSTIFLSTGRDRIAIEWTWTSTRSRDGARQSMSDAIIVELEHKLIRRWTEYFDTHESIEFE